MSRQQQHGRRSRGYRRGSKIVIRLKNCALVFGCYLALTQIAFADCRTYSIQPSDLAVFETQLNATREAEGLPRLRLNTTLNQIALTYACEMAETRHFAHVALDGSNPAMRAQRGGYRYCSIGENLAAGMDELASADEGWRNSPGHYATYVMESGREFGIAAAIGTARSETVEAGSSFGALSDRYGGLVVGNGPGESYDRFYWVMLVGASGC